MSRIVYYFQLSALQYLHPWLCIVHVQKCTLCLLTDWSTLFKFLLAVSEGETYCLWTWKLWFIWTYKQCYQLHKTSQYLITNVATLVSISNMQISSVLTAKIHKVWYFSVLSRIDCPTVRLTKKSVVVLWEIQCSWYM